MERRDKSAFPINGSEGNHVHGNVEDGTLRQFVVMPTIHQVSALNARGMEAACEFLANFMPDTE